MSYDSTHPAAPPNSALLAAVNAAMDAPYGWRRLMQAVSHAMGVQCSPHVTAVVDSITKLGPDVVAAVISEFAADTAPQDVANVKGT